MSVLDVLSNKNVLYAEDEKGIANNIVEILELFFNKVTQVDDGLEALIEFKTNSYDVLIFDIYMPNLDGLQVIKKIRKYDKKIPIIILSAHTEQEYLWRAVELKITKYLAKPYSKSTLIEALELCALELVDFNTQVKLSKDIVYDINKKTIISKNSVTSLSKSESRLLDFFIQRANQVVTFENISEYIWDFDSPSKEAIKSIVKEIRRKIGKDLIKNKYGVGYIFEL